MDRRSKTGGVHLFRKWRHWLDLIDEHQLQDLLINHHRFEQFRQMIKSHNGSGHLDLAAWITQGQLAFMCTAIRRITEKQHRWQIISLRKLLDDLAEHANLHTRERFQQLYTSPIGGKFADRDFNRIAGKEAGSLSKEKIEADIAGMESRVELVTRLTDKVIAHTEQNRSDIEVPPTYGQLRRLVLWLEKLYGKYHLLIKGREYSPTPLDDYDLSKDFGLFFRRSQDIFGADRS